MKASLFLLPLLLATLVDAKGERYRRIKREADKEKGTDELNHRKESGWKEFKEGALKEVKGDWLVKSIVLAKFWRLANFDKTIGLQKIKEASNWMNERKKIPRMVYEDIQGKMDASMGHKDKDGRVILYQNLGKNDMSKYTADEKERHQWEETFRELWMEASEKAVKRWEDEKNDYAKFTLLYNYDGWTTENGGCLTCIDFTRTLAKDFDGYFPRMVSKVFLINTGFEFNAFFNVIRLVLAKETNEIIDVYDNDESQWKKKVGKYIDEKVIKELLK